MTDLKHEYVFTKHLRERFVQRSEKKYSHIQGCKEQDCETCKSMQTEIRDGLEKNRRPVDTELNRRISNAEENRSYINNSTFMEWFYEKYGYDKTYQFLVHEDMLFVAVVEGSRKVVVTCIPAKNHVVGKAELRPKFKKKKVGV